MTNLEFWRRRQGLTQREAAELLGPGFSEASISLLESGRLRPSLRQLAGLERVFGAEAATLLEPVADNVGDHVS